MNVGTNARSQTTSAYTTNSVQLSNAVFHFSRGYMCKKKVKQIGTSLVEGAVNDFSF